MWADWLTHRKVKRAPVTQTVLVEAEREARKAGVTLQRFLEIWCSRGSQGLQAEWLKPHERSPPGGTDRKSRQLTTAALMTGAARQDHQDHPDAIDVDSRIIPTRCLG